MRKSSYSACAISASWADDGVGNWVPHQCREPVPMRASILSKIGRLARRWMTRRFGSTLVISLVFAPPQTVRIASSFSVSSRVVAEMKRSCSSLACFIVR